MFFNSSRMYYQHSLKQQSCRRGFGLIELMVSMSIMALVSAVIITRQSSFNGAVLLRNQAYEVAFVLREAQLLAVSGGDETVRRYGVYFNTGNATQHQYILFKDSDGDGRYDSGEQIGLTGKLDTRFEIREAYSGTSLMSEMVVLFERPNFDAKFINSSGVVQNDTVAFIDVARTDVSGTTNGTVRRVQISQTGQISVVTY
jgi:prepilin-type N-terminal cleavage/methylation domain-containing protein